MKAVVSSLLEGVAELFDGALRAGVMALASYVRQIDLPDGDDRWERVADVLREALQDIAAARELDTDARMQARLAAERRMHHQLRELGLIEVSE